MHVSVNYAKSSCIRTARPLKRTEKIKEEGNAGFKTGKYQAAVDP
jgi:hypothetical protein